MLKIWSRLRSWTWSEKIMWLISRSVSSSWTQLRCFHRCWLSLSKVNAEKLPVAFYDLQWPWSHEEGSLMATFPIQCVNSTWNPMSKSVQNGFRPKRRISCFHWLTMEGPQNWPEQISNQLQISTDQQINQISTDITDIKILRYTFYRHCYLYQSLKDSRQSFGRCSLTNIQTFYEVRLLDVTWWPGSAIFTSYAEKMYDKVCQKRLNKKLHGGCVQTPPPPSGARVIVFACLG